MSNDFKNELKEGILEELRRLKREFSQQNFETSQAIEEIEYALDGNTVERLGSQETVDLQNDSLNFIISTNRKTIEFNNQIIEDIKVQERKVKEMF
jgi:methylthioribose-1-phosphate isomerase